MWVKSKDWKKREEFGIDFEGIRGKKESIFIHFISVSFSSIHSFVDVLIVCFFRVARFKLFPSRFLLFFSKKKFPDICCVCLGLVAGEFGLG